MTKKVCRDEQIELIMECRKSGLTDYQWCNQKGINPSTFYNWVSKLRKAGYSIPDSDSKTTGISIKQEVIKLDFFEHEDDSRHMREQNTRILTNVPSSSIAAEIVVGNVSIRLYNGADSQLIQNVIQSIGGINHAW